MKYRARALAFLLLLAGAASAVEIRVFKTLAAGESGIVNVRQTAAHLITIVTAPDSASQVLTFTGNSADADTFTVDVAVYTTESGTVGTAFEVNDAASAALFIVNLCAAINANGVGDGTDYAAGTTAHPNVTCSASTATTLTVTAITAGSNANAIDTTTTSAAASWGAATLTDVVDPIATISRVDSPNATTHGTLTSTVTATSPTVEVFEVDWPFYFVSAAVGSVRVGVAQ